MAYLKPPAFTRRLANPLAMGLNGRGVGSLTVVGRRTCKPHKVPVSPVELGGSRYLVSPYGESGMGPQPPSCRKGQLSRKGRTETFHAVEVPVDQRAPVISRYREVAGRVVDPCFTKLPDARDHPVFEVDQSGPGR